MDISIFFLVLCLLQLFLYLRSSSTLDTLRGTSLSVEKPTEKLVSANGEFSAGVSLLEIMPFPLPDG
ncbi:hypothetical protein ACB092_03G007700 [Castanea dentata]